MQKKYCWSLDQYNTFNKLCIALTNFHLMWHPLCVEDFQFCIRMKYYLAEIAADIAWKWKATQKKYQLNHKNKLAQKMFVAVGEACSEDTASD